MTQSVANVKFEGAIPALLTPYDSADAVSEDMLCRLVDVHVNAGMQGLYLCGGTGEGLLLRASERKKVVEVVVRQSGGRLPVIVHVGSVATREAIELACHAEQAGAAAISCIPPFFYPASTEAIYHHYAQIADCCKLPMLLYNIPSAVNITVTPAMMGRFMEISSVTGMKFSSYNLFQLWQMTQLDQGRLNVLSGNDEVFLAALAMGAHGSIGLTHNFMPRLYVDIFNSFRSAQWDQAQRLQNYANQIISVLLDYPVVPACKEIMRLKGYDCGSSRSPLEGLHEEQKQALCRELTVLGFFEKELGIG